MFLGSGTMTPMAHLLGIVCRCHKRLHSTHTAVFIFRSVFCQYSAMVPSLPTQWVVSTVALSQRLAHPSWERPAARWLHCARNAAGCSEGRPGRVRRGGLQA